MKNKEIVEIITDQHFNGHDHETGVDFTCSKCWKICLCRSYNYCPQCGVKLEWNLTEASNMDF